MGQATRGADPLPPPIFTIIYQPIRTMAYTKEQMREYNKQYRLNNKEEIRKKAQEKWLIMKHDPNYLAKRRAWLDANKEEVNRQARERRANPEYAEVRRKQRRESYHQLMQDLEYRKLVYQRQAKSNKKNPQTMLSRILRGRVLHAVRNANTFNSAPTTKLIGCSIAKLMNHIESLFDDKMTWNNRGFYGWHIDHITPCASYDLTDPQQQLECFHYTNLQPLWCTDNWKKNDNLLKENKT